MIILKRVYLPVSEKDGFRILVERLWPRGVSKQNARIDLWLKDVAPSLELRVWYAHDVEKWEEFQRRYRKELMKNPAVEPLKALVKAKKKVTFVFAARDEDHNSARVLKAFLERRVP
jgi:uncharacterized protein YeaO (DUF488 family)